MASLSGNKIKDTYTQLLKLESSEVSATEQVVEDGAGNNSALKLSTDTVETTGDLKISGTPATTTTDVKALMLSTSGVVVTRNLSTNPIGTASLTATSPLSATGSTIEIKDAGTLSQISSPANNDKFLIWDESASSYKYIDQDDLATAVNTLISATQEQSLFARPSADTAVNTSALTAIQFTGIVGDSASSGTSQATSSVMFGPTGTNSILGINQAADPQDSILLNETAGYFKITASVQLDSTANTDVDLQIYNVQDATALATTFRTVKASETYHAEFSALYYSDGAQGYQIQLRAQAGGSTVTVKQTTTFVKAEYLGANLTF